MTDIVRDNLCWYDPRSTSYVQPYPPDDVIPPRREGCGCDPCFQGRDKMAVEIDGLRAEADELRRMYSHATVAVVTLDDGQERECSGGVAAAYGMLRAERDALRDFVAALFDASDWPQGGDIDLCAFQDLAHAHGILIEETRTAPCREDCWCAEYHGGAEGMAEGVTCYRKPAWLIAAGRKLASSRQDGAAPD